MSNEWAIVEVIVVIVAEFAKEWTTAMCGGKKKQKALIFYVPGAFPPLRCNTKISKGKRSSSSRLNCRQTQARSPQHTPPFLSL